MNKFLGLLLILVACAAAYLLAWPVPIEPVAWQAPEAPELTGKYADNNRLAGAEWLGKDVAAGPEDVAVDEQGRVYGGFADGTIRRFGPDGGNTETLADTGGRPLGLAWAPDGSLVIADAFKGLLAMRTDGSLRTLADSADGVPLGFADDVDVAADGTVYLSDASTKFGLHEAMTDILEHGGNGRLLKYEPLADRVTVLATGLQFANGVAVGPDERYVLVNETGAYRVQRYWLQGPKAGSTEVLIDNLPGIPDGVSFDGEDTFWVALFAPRNDALDYMADKPMLRKIVYRLPQALQPKPARRAFVLGLAPDGSVAHNLQATGENVYAPITSVEQVGESLYLGSLERAAVGRVPAP